MSGEFSLSPDRRLITLARFHYYKNCRMIQPFSQMKIDLSEVVSQREAAKMRGVSIQAIHKLMKRGRFTVIEVSGKRFLLRKEVEAFVPRRTGRPRKDSAAAESPQSAKATKRRGASKTTSSKKRAR